MVSVPVTLSPRAWIIWDDNHLKLAAQLQGNLMARLGFNYPFAPEFSSVQFSSSVMSNSVTPWSFLQFSSVAQSCLILSDPLNRSMADLPVHHQLPEATQTHLLCVSDAIQPSHPLSFPSCLQSFLIEITPSFSDAMIN